jgi:hypothetical protein
MRINPFLYGIFVLVVFLGTILGFQTAGVWSVSGKISSNGEAVQPIASDVNSIKGWMTLEQISMTFNVPVKDILKQFELPADTAPSTAIKDLETQVFSVTNLRNWLQNRTEPAPALIETQVSTPQVTLSPVETNAPALVEPTLTPAATEHITAAKTVTGKTTFQELLDWGVPEEAIQQIIGGKLPALSTVIKDYITGKGLEFSSMKAALQVEVDKTK